VSLASIALALASIVGESGTGACAAATIDVTIKPTHKYAETRCEDVSIMDCVIFFTTKED
jgi:hypothetical protein